MENQIEIYKGEDGQTAIEVKFENDTVWLDQVQLVDLFRSSKPNISEHLKSIFKSGELDPESTVRKFRTVRQEGKRLVSRSLEHYNLDVIISLGYKVNTKQGIRFRQWATKRLKDYLVTGIAVNQKRLEQLQQTIQLISESGKVGDIQLNEAKGLLEIIGNYTGSFKLLDKYDRNTLSAEKLTKDITYEIKYDEARKAIDELKARLLENEEANSLFGNEKDDGFKSSLKSIVQTFDGEYLYPSIEEQAACLLYFVIKNHSFVDGNKRIGAFLFIWFLERNKHRFKKSGELKINDNGLTALALLVAQSNPSDKDAIIKLTMNLTKNS